MSLQLQKLQAHIDDLYKGALTYDFASNGDSESQAIPGTVTGLTEEAFGRLGRTQPQVRCPLRTLILWLGCGSVASLLGLCIMSLLCVTQKAIVMRAVTAQMLCFPNCKDANKCIHEVGLVKAYQGNPSLETRSIHRTCSMKS